MTDRPRGADPSDDPEGAGSSRVELDPDATAAVSDPAGLTAPGALVGRYRLLEQIGEGGFGEVWVAEQKEPVQRRVALKIVKAGMDTREVLARFEVERQALALMDHPNIAKVHDAGATPTGRPYFVMEHVAGIPITDYCDTARLKIPERLQLFISVCKAVQHAHAKGIIHRDLKPSNILVAAHDGQPVPKVIDFGIAKATIGRLTDRTLYTQSGSMLGTPEYMAPEQALTGGLDVDTRADVYSLGVILYELLTGTLPFDPKTLRSAGFEGMAKLLREMDPPNPSTRLSSMTVGGKRGGQDKGDTDQIAKQHGVDVATLRRELRGDLDWITMKAMEKDRSRRYETANGLALDVQRFLRKEPVLAGPPSARYRLRKFVQRNAGAVVAASLVVCALIVGVIGTTWAMLWALDEKRLADEARSAEHVAREAAELAHQDEATQRQRAEENEHQARAAEAEARAVLGFIQEKVLTAGRPVGEEGGLGRDVTLLRAIQVAEPAIGSSFQEQPVAEASIRHALGETYAYLGEAARAIPHLERALALREQHLEPDHAEILHTRNRLLWMYLDAGRVLDGLAIGEALLPLLREHLGADDRETYRCMHSLALAYFSVGKIDQGLELAEEHVEQQRAHLGPDHTDTLAGMTNLSAYYIEHGRINQALATAEQARTLAESRYGLQHPVTLQSLTQLAWCRFWSGKDVAGATELLYRSYTGAKTALGPGHPLLLTNVQFLVYVYQNSGQHQKVMDLAQEAFDLARKELGADDVRTLQYMSILAGAHDGIGQTERALSLSDEAYAAARHRLGSEHPGTLQLQLELARRSMQHGQFERARALFSDTIEVARRVQGDESQFTLFVMAERATLSTWTKEYARCVEEFDELLAIYRAAYGDDYHGTLTIMNNRAYAIGQLGRLQEAEDLFIDILERERQAIGTHHLLTLQSLANLGDIYLAQDEFAEAEQALRECATMRAEQQPNSFLLASTQAPLGTAIAKQGRHAEAEALLLESYQGLKANIGVTPGWGRHYLPDSVESLIELYESWGKTDQAEQWRNKLDEAKELARPRTTVGT